MSSPQKQKNSPQRRSKSWRNKTNVASFPNSKPTNWKLMLKGIGIYFINAMKLVFLRIDTGQHGSSRSCWTNRRLKSGNEISLKLDAAWGTSCSLFWRSKRITRIVPIGFTFMPATSLPELLTLCAQIRSTILNRLQPFSAT